jgi:hypothetical protein
MYSVQNETRSCEIRKRRKLSFKQTHSGTTVKISTRGTLFNAFEKKEEEKQNGGFVCG